MKGLFLKFGMLFASALVFCADLTILQEDIFIERNSGRSIGTSRNGFNVYIRKKDGVQSIMFVETTKDPAGRADNFAYRALEYNSLNGDEKRYLNGKLLTSEYSKNSLISSTVVQHPRLGDCFLIYVPPTLQYGYPWTRNGSVTIEKGTFVNIRTFTEKYGDYSGDFKDNPFMFDFMEIPEEEKTDPPQPAPVVLTDEYSPEAAESFTNIASSSDGGIVFSKPEKLAEDLERLIADGKRKDSVDIVFAVDTTGSMKDDLEHLQKEWVPRLIKQIKGYDSMRLGLLFYRDYNDSYNYKSLPVKIFGFTYDVGTFAQNLGTPLIRGNEGGDKPEAVYEALYASLEYFDWRSNAERRIILIGDAEPHPRPRGTKKITREMVMSQAKSQNVRIDCIIVPNTKPTNVKGI